MPYIPHTEDDIYAMLTSIGVANIDALFDEIPHTCLQQARYELPIGMNEMNMLKLAHKRAQQTQNLTCFIGAGSYEHHIPAAVWDIASRGEWLTAYTPYQAEASQGSLQLLYEFQTMIAELTGMEVANASLYDGATALAEAVLMAIRIHKKNHSRRILVPQTLHPFYRDTLQTILTNQQIELITIPYDQKTGVTSLAALQHYTHQDVTALIIPQPNVFGCLEDVDALCDWAHKQQAIAIACVNPIAMGILQPPGSWGSHGVDISCGDGQPLGCPMASGGPYFGFFSTRKQFVRQMPGRLIGRTVDLDGQTGYTLTLQAREQHIRRGKATSNICTNQGLLVTAATIHMSLLGASGLEQVALASHHNTHALVDQLCRIPGITKAFTSPLFHEAVLLLNKPPAKVLRALAKEGIAGGLEISPYYPELKHALLVCATEMRTEAEITRFSNAINHILNSEKSLC